MKHLKQLRDAEYEEGAKVTLQNAKNNIKVAEEAAKINQFGIANSLSIVGIEELVKASILKIKSINPKIKIDNLDRYFRNHSLKHEAIMPIFIASVTYSNSYYESEKSIVETKDEKKEQDRHVTTIIIILLVVYLLFLKSKESKESLEDLRKAGFYIDFDPENRSWKIPNDIFSSEKYDLFKEQIDLVFKIIEESLFSGNINSENILEFIDKLKDEKIITEHLKNINLIKEDFEDDLEIDFFDIIPPPSTIKKM